jgi:hydroxymethylglutaryl-CoA reductase
MQNPSAKELMEVVVAGLAQNFAALRSNHDQDGHMKMHLNNILNQFEANDDERIQLENTSNTIRYAAAADYI